MTPPAPDSDPRANLQQEQARKRREAAAGSRVEANVQQEPARERREAAAGSGAEAAGSEHGDRAAFLRRIRARQGPPTTVGPHPPPPAPVRVPEIGYRALDGLDGDDPDALLPVFVAAARDAAAIVHPDGDAGACLAEVVARHNVRRAVLSSEPEAQALRPALERLGVGVKDHETGAGAVADLGVTSAVAAVAVTGTVVVDSDAAGGRGASLLPAVHLCVVPRQRLVATPSDVFRRGPVPLPSCRVLITGPSRTGDIEQIITLGAHGPVAVHIVVT